MLKIGIVGGTGKLGRQLVEFLLVSDKLKIGAVAARPGNQFVGVDVGVLVGQGEIGQTVVDDLAATNCDVYIDCTNAAGFNSNYVGYVQLKKPLIIATTGLDGAAMEKVATLAETAPVLVCPNFSLGVYKFLRIVSQAARELAELEPDIVIIEAHHMSKKDQPSGTAKRLAECIAAQGIAPEKIAVQSIRAGNIIGEHTVMFVTEDERIELTHRAASRSGFAKGVVKAIEWLVQQQNGLYQIDDLFGDA